MSTVGILTFHDGINHGAFFQALALQTYLNKLGLCTSLVNYKNKQHWILEYKVFLYTKNPHTFFRNLIKM